MTLPPLPDELAPLARFIESSARPCIAMAVIPDSKPDGSRSKMGGRPVLPKGFTWPKHEGAALDFLLQIDLTTVPHGADFGLPGSGLLSFFYDLRNCPWNPEVGGAFQVAYAGPDAELVTTASPGRNSGLVEALLVFRSGLSIPYFGSIALGDFQERILKGRHDEVSDDELDELAEAYGDYCRRVSRFEDPNPDGGPHRMFGHPENIQDDMMAGNDEWTMLLQLSSDDTIDLNWGDSGMLYFWIRKSDLATLRFDRVVMMLQSC